jgi:hypothetical protein
MNAQLDLFAQARKRRDAGMALAADAEREEWKDRAYAALVSVARRSRLVHVDDLLSEFTEEPEHPNAWGSVWMRAVRSGVLRHSGCVRPCKCHPRKNAHQYPIYQSLVAP